MWSALALSIIVVVYNNVANRWEPFHGTVYVPLNLAFAVTLAIIASSTVDLSRRDLGLSARVSDVLVPLIGLAVFTLGAFVLAGSRHRHRIADRRVAHLRGRALAFYVLVRIPVGTALTEEMIFRGVLYATWRAAGMSPLIGALCAAVAFGLWHIEPTRIGMRMNDPDAARRKMLFAVAGAVLFTAVAGLGLTWLRVETGGLAAPIVLHAGVNSIGALAAVKAHRGDSISSS